MTEKELIELIHNTKNGKKLIDQLKEQKLPLIMWGAGSMAYSVKKYLDRNHIELSGVLVDNSKENEKFDNIPILSMTKINEKNNKINIIMGHSQYNLGHILLESNPLIQTIFYLPSVCYSQYDPISYDFIVKHAKEYVGSYNVLADELSKKCMIAYLNARVNEEPFYIFECCSEKNSYFNNVAFHIDESEIYLDIGAYTGDTIEEFIHDNKGKYQEIVAIEPEKESFEKLKKYVRNQQLHDVKLYQIGCWYKKDRLYLTSDEESSSVTDHVCEDYIDVEKIDDLVTDTAVTLLKINYLQGVLETLQGAQKTIRKYKPKLVITVGFDEYALINIPKYIKKLDTKYKVYLRYNAAMPARLTLYAVIDEIIDK